MVFRIPAARSTNSAASFTLIFIECDRSVSRFEFFLCFGREEDEEGLKAQSVTLCRSATVSSVEATTTSTKKQRAPKAQDEVDSDSDSVFQSTFQGGGGLGSWIVVGEARSRFSLSELKALQVSLTLSR